MLTVKYSNFAKLVNRLHIKKDKLLFDNNIQIYQESELKFCMF